MLEPFARIPLSHTDDIDDSATVFKYEGGAITLGDLRRVHAALTASPAAVESNASVEARLREAVLVSIDMIENCAGVPTNPDSLPQMVKVYLQQTISAVGDEAKKSDGAIYAEVSKLETPPEERAEIERVIDKALQDQSVCEALERRHSDPTAERREIVARIEARAQAYDSSAGALYLGAVVAKELRAILAALDGGASA